MKYLYDAQSMISFINKKCHASLSLLKTVISNLAHK